MGTGRTGKFSITLTDGFWEPTVFFQELFIDIYFPALGAAGSLPANNMPIRDPQLHSKLSFKHL